MTFLSPSSFYFLIASVVLILLSLLRARARRHHVSALFLWIGLTQIPEPRSVKLQRWMDPLLFLQLAVLAVMVLTLVQPISKSQQTAFHGFAVVLDASASMQTVAEDGRTRYELAVDRALDILANVSSSRTTLIHYSSSPAVLVPPTDDESAVLRALEASEPSWRSDGVAADLVDLFSAVGGLDEYDRIVLLSDHTPPDLPPGVEVELFQQGINVGITALAVREDLSSPGVSVFLELSNETASFLEPRVTLRDEFYQTTFSFLLGPQTTDRYVMPFPMSRGTRFTATLEGDDDYPFDNVRYFALARPSSLRVHWIGADNRFLRAALESVLPVRLVDADQPRDLTVVIDRTLDEPPEGNLLLVHAGIPGRVHVGDPQAGGFAWADQVDDPLLAGIDAEDIYVETLPAVEVFLPATTLLSVNAFPLLIDASTDERTIVVLSTDLTATNLPITVDFPLLIRNLVARLRRLPSPLAHEWHTVGQLIDAEAFGQVMAARDPGGESIELSPKQPAIPTDQPGFYLLETRDGVIPIAVNIDPSESFRPQGADPLTEGDLGGQTETREMLRRLWPYFAIVALVLLVTEAVVYVRSELAAKGVG
jgi:hypothetical protein